MRELSKSEILTEREREPNVCLRFKYIQKISIVNNDLSKNDNILHEEILQNRLPFLTASAIMVKKYFFKGEAIL